jgi:hypothetical protein
MSHQQAAVDRPIEPASDLEATRPNERATPHRSITHQPASQPASRINPPNRPTRSKARTPNPNTPKPGLHRRGHSGPAALRRISPLTRPGPTANHPAGCSLHASAARRARHGRYDPRVPFCRLVCLVCVCACMCMYVHVCVVCVCLCVCVCACTCVFWWWWWWGGGEGNESC